MKKLFTLLIALVVAYSGFSQVPEEMSYQAVIRNSSDELVKSSPVGMQISVLQGSESGTPVYVETHSTSTNINGLATIEIGGGIPTTGTFSDIDWSTGIYFLKTETDPAGGISYSIIGTSQILSVPYALHAKSAENITGEIDYTEVDPVFIASQASNITETDIINLSNLSGTNTGDQDLSLFATKDMGNENITNLADPIDDMDAANKAYVDILEMKIKMLANSLYSGGVVKDIEGNIYNTVTIGSQTWFAENLKTTKYNDGTSIPIVEEQSAWSNLTTPAYCWYDNDQNTYGEIYGALYNWYAVNTEKLCPSGWHVPDNNDWMQLIGYLGGLDVAGAKIKMEGLIYWDSPNLEATNETGFSAIPGGWRSDNFYGIGTHSSFISSSDLASFVGVFIAYSYQIRMDYGASGFDGGLSVRCIKD